jgi:hypothetical protein
VTPHESTVDSRVDEMTTAALGLSATGDNVRAARSALGVVVVTAGNGDT